MHDLFARPAVIAAVALSSLLACSKASETTPTSPPPTSEAPAAAPEPAAGPARWSEATSHDDKAAFMSKHVVPAMAPIFQGADAEHYAEFGCKTCHGPQGTEPTDFLPRLTVKDGHLVEMETHPEVSKMMAEQVVPKMIEVLGATPFDPATGQGFGCGGCHGIDMQ